MNISFELLADSILFLIEKVNWESLPDHGLDLERSETLQRSLH